MTSEKEKYLEKRLPEIHKEWKENPLPPSTPVIDIEREAIPMSYDAPDSGKPLCSKPPYRYVKSAENKDVWEIDEVAAEVVRKIFKLCISGI